MKQQLGNLLSRHAATSLAMALTVSTTALATEAHASQSSADVVPVISVRPNESPRNSDALNAEARALADDEGTTIGEAKRKLRWQQRTSLFIETARKHAPSVFGGAWIENGAVRAWVTGEDASAGRSQLAQLADRHELGPISTQTGRHTELSLVALQGQIDSALAVVNSDAGLTVDVEHDVRRNRLVLNTPPTPTESQRALVEKLLDAYPTAISRGETSAGIRKQCSGPWCNPPLRGGVGLLYGTSHACTAGLIVASVSDYKRYITTQKHCLDAYGYGTWSSGFANYSIHHIGPPHNTNSSDLAILRINNEPGWSPLPYIRMHGNSAYPIYGATIPAVGHRTCVSGSHGWNRNNCGTVTYGLATRHGITNTMRAELASCTVGGDSGAPYFSYGIAQGTHIGLYGSHPCGTAFTALNALANMNVQTVVF